MPPEVICEKASTKIMIEEMCDDEEAGIFNEVGPSDRGFDKFMNAVAELRKEIDDIRSEMRGQQHYEAQYQYHGQNRRWETPPQVLNPQKRQSEINEMNYMEPVDFDYEPRHKQIAYSNQGN